MELPTTPTTSPASVLDILREAAAAVQQSLEGLRDWGPSGTRRGQYHSDLVADRAALEVLGAAGFSVLSEESGHRNGTVPVTVVVDPVDGSTNASRGLDWWATSLCALDDSGPLAAVVNQPAAGRTFEATRGGGAFCNGSPIEPSGCETLGAAIVGLSGFPARHLGWSQFRCFGAAALDLCAVASGSLDAFIDCAPTSLAPWDYLGGLLICSEAGACVADAFGRDVVDLPDRRAIVAAATPQLLDEVVAVRLGLRGS